MEKLNDKDLLPWQININEHARMKDFAFALSQLGTDERQLTLDDILRDGDAASGTFYDFVTWDMFLAEGGTMPSLTET